MASPEESTLELSTADKLDDEISKLKAQVESLKRDLQLHATTLLASEPVRAMILRDDDDDDNDNDNDNDNDEDSHRAAARRQEAHAQQCLYRACASATAFRVRDPDPRAADGGRMLGVRIEVMSRSRFARPYFVMLNRPYHHHHHPAPGARDHLRVHRHTVPACVPLAGLAARYLPPPSRTGTTGDRDDVDDEGEGEGEGEGGERTGTGRKKNNNNKNNNNNNNNKQDLPRFVRALRRELVRYHNRTAVVGDLQRAAGLEGGNRRRRSREVMDPAIVDVSAADTEVKQVRVEWADGRSGRLVMDDDGAVLRMVVQAADGRDRETARRFLGGAARVEEISRHF